MLNLKTVWILALFSMVVLGGCAAETLVTEPAPSNKSSVAVEEDVLPASTVSVTTEQTPSTSPSMPAATDMKTGAEMETAVSTNPSSTSPQPTPTPLHATPIPPKTTPSNPGDQVDTFLVRSLNTEPGTSFEDLAVERSKQHLSQKLQVSVEDITLVSINRTELDNSNLCQSPTNAGKGSENHGTTLGYEIILSVDNQTYRYVISRNLGYYCAN